MLNKDDLLLQKDLTESVIHEIQDSGLPVVLWGFGGRIPVIWDYLPDAGIRVSHICDNDPEKVGKMWDGVEVISFARLKDTYEDCNIIIVPPISRIVSEIERQLLTDGQFKRIYHFEMYYPYGESMKDIFREHFEELQDIYAFLADDRSRKVLEEQLYYAVTKDRGRLTDFSGEVYFDEDVLEIGDQEVFCDCGVLDGGTTLRLKELKGFEKAYCFEPEPQNHRLCQRTLDGEPGIELVNAAVWSEKGKMAFTESLGGGSTVSSRGEILVDTIRLDDFFADKRLTFIKMDIEGAEVDALTGAKCVLKGQAPMLAIAAYHKMTDLWDIPLLIREANPDYHIYIRRYIDQGGYERLVYYARV